MKRVNRLNAERVTIKVLGNEFGLTPEEQKVFHQLIRPELAILENLTYQVVGSGVATIVCPWLGGITVPTAVAEVICQLAAALIHVGSFGVKGFAAVEKIKNGELGEDVVKLMSGGNIPDNHEEFVKVFMKQARKELRKLANNLLDKYKGVNYEDYEDELSSEVKGYIQSRV